MANDEERLEDEAIRQLVDERIKAADMSLGTSLEDAALELGFEPAEIFG